MRIFDKSARKSLFFNKVYLTFIDYFVIFYKKADPDGKATLQENVEVIDAERELLIAENNDLKNEIKLLQKEILHKDEVIVLHKIILGLNHNKE